MLDPFLPWILQEREVLVENWLLRLERERCKTARGDLAHDFYVLHLRDGVNTIALTPERQLVLIEQYRYAARTAGLELPGGFVEPDESPLAAAARELSEETGYAGGPPRLLGTVFAQPALQSNRLSFVVVPDVLPVAAARPEPTEEIRVRLVAPYEIPGLIREKLINNAHTVMGLWWWIAEQMGRTV